MTRTYSLSIAKLGLLNIGPYPLHGGWEVSENFFEAFHILATFFSLFLEAMSRMAAIET